MGANGFLNGGTASMNGDICIDQIEVSVTIAHRSENKQSYWNVTDMVSNVSIAIQGTRPLRPFGTCEPSLLTRAFD